MVGSESLISAFGLLLLLFPRQRRWCVGSGERGFSINNETKANL